MLFTSLPTRTMPHSISSRMSYSCRARRLRHTGVARASPSADCLRPMPRLYGARGSKASSQKIAREKRGGRARIARGRITICHPTGAVWTAGRTSRPPAGGGERPNMTNVLLLPERRTMRAEEDHAGLTALMTELHPATVADWTEGLTVEETWKVFNHAGIDRQGGGFEFFPIKKQVDMATGAGRERMSRLIEAMAHDERVDLLKRLDPEVVVNLLPLVAKADRADIRTLLSYPEHSAGSVMTTEYATLTTDLTVSEAISRLRLQATSAETIYYVYVVDAERHLVGFVSLHDLILARPSARVESIMQREVISVPVDADQEDVAQTMARYDCLALPVVDSESRLVGIVTHDDVIDVVVLEATEDALRMGGVGAMVEHYLDAPFITLWRKRSGWLACLFVAELFTFSALAHFEGAIQKIVALSLFVPLCISTGGNSGSQA